MTVLYAAGSGRESLADAQRLVLRARLRTALDPSRPGQIRKRVVASLQRNGGLFTGWFRLPDDVVYGAFVVETPDGERVGSNEGRPWELLVRGLDGRPLAEALQQRIQDHMGVDMSVVLDASERLTVLYPDQPLSWMLLTTAQRWTAGSAAQVEVNAALAERFAGLDARFRGRHDLRGIDLASMMWQAMLAGDSAAHRYWRARVLSETPEYPVALRERMFAVERRRRHKPGVLLDTLDAIWREAETAPPPSDFLARHVMAEMAGVAFQAAIDAGRTGEQVSWADRWRTLEPHAAPELALAGVAANRTGAMRRLRARVTDYRRPDDARRELGVTRSAQASKDAREAGTLLGVLGAALVESGATTAGIDTLEAAIRLAPRDQSALRALAEAHMAAGDTAAALRAWAGLAAEPSTSATFVDSVRSRIRDRFDRSGWERLVERTRARSLDLVMRDAIRRSVPVGMRLTTTDGNATTLDAVRGKANEAIVVFWSRFCAAAMDAMPEVQTLARSLAEDGVPVIVVTDDVADRAFRAALRKRKITLAVYHDADGSVARAFGIWGTPSYYVVDGNGDIRFEQSDFDDLRLQVMALRRHRGILVSGDG